MKKFFLLFALYIILIPFQVPILAQQNKIDSLLIVLKTAPKDTSRINVLNLLVKQYISIGSYEQAVSLSQQAIQQAEKFQYKKGIGYAYNNLGSIFSAQGDYEKALSNYLKALNIYEDIGDKKGIAGSYNYVGSIFMSLHNFKKALENFEKSLKINVEITNKRGIANVYINIGNIYFYQRNYKKALDNYFEVAKIRNEMGDKPGAAGVYNNIGVVYMYLNDYEKSLEYHFKVLKIREETNDVLASAGSYHNIGNVYIKQNKLKEAYYYLTHSLQIFKQVGFKEGIKDTYSSLSDLYDKSGDYKKACEYDKLYIDLKDSLLNEKSSRQIVEMNAKYDSEKKDKALITKDTEIAKQQAETEKQNLQRNAFIIGLVLVLVLAFFIFRSYRQKRTANELLKEKNGLIETQKKLVEEKNNKITDSLTYAKRIQQAILPTQELVKLILPQSFIFFKPKDIVSGDFYWMHAINKDEILFTVVDCTGHGVPGALMSIIGYNLLEQVVKEHHIYEPAMILKEVSKLMKDSLKQNDESAEVKDGMDIALCKINYQNKELEYAGAHNSLYLIRNGILTETKADRRSVGISHSKSDSFLNHKIKLEKEDCLYIFSDGYADQKGGAENKKLFYSTFKELLVTIHQLPLEEQKEYLKKTITEWIGNKEQIDDMLIIGVKI